MKSYLYTVIKQYDKKELGNLTKREQIIVKCFKSNDKFTINSFAKDNKHNKPTSCKNISFITINFYL